MYKIFESIVCHLVTVNKQEFHELIMHNGEIWVVENIEAFIVHIFFLFVFVL